MESDKLMQLFIVKPGSKISLKKDYDPGFTASFVKRAEAKESLREGVELLTQYQDRLYAQGTHALLIVIQALDAAGKDSAIKHVMSGLNPQGCQVHSFKVPSVEELAHDFLWRSVRALPGRGYIGIFNRSYYEEVLVVRVHPDLLANQKLPPECTKDNIWEHRFEDINNFEKYLTDNGTAILKFFLNVSKKEQKERFLERIDRPEKNWKFSAADVNERSYWDDYMKAYEDVLNHTSTRWAPWYVLPADHKWFTRLAMAAVIVGKMQELDPQYPQLPDAEKKELGKAKDMLLKEKD